MPSPRSESKTSQSSKHSRYERKYSHKPSSVKHSNASKSHEGSASNSQSTNKTANTSGQGSYTNSFEYKPAQLNNHNQPYVSISSTDQQVFYSQQYSTDVISGCTSLDIEVPSSMHQALVDQHGFFTLREFSCSTVMVDPQYTLDSLYLVMNSTIDQGYTYSKEEFGGDLAGVGAQFEGMKIV